jgi:hypothetical protein
MTPKRDATKVERPKAPSPVTVGKRSATFAWPIMATVKYVEAADAYMDQQDARVRELEGMLKQARHSVSYHAVMTNDPEVRTLCNDLRERIVAALGEKNV